MAVEPELPYSISYELLLYVLQKVLGRTGVGLIEAGGKCFRPSSQLLGVPS